MKYTNVCEGIFIERPNRFIAYVNVDGEKRICHVKNTGRCRELLISGARVILEHCPAEGRKTEYDLIAVYKGDTLINIDSQAPNKAFGEWVADCGHFGELTLIRPERTFGNSRFDFYLETAEKRIFVEVKGVTLERNGIYLFPDAPTERGAKHLSELAAAIEAGYDAYVFFVIQANDCKYFTPNGETDPAFAKALRRAAERGVKVCAVTCDVAPDGMKITDHTEVRL